MIQLQNFFVVVIKWIAFKLNKKNKSKIKYEDIISEIDNRVDFIQLCLFEKPSSKSIMNIASAKFDRANGWIKIENCVNQSENYDRGIGSVAMRIFLDFCSSQGFSHITGDIIEEDWDINIVRLKHFYKKFGFKVKLNYRKKEGQIELRLAQNGSPITL